MKKLFLAAITTLTALLPATAQTDFRHISFDEAKAASKAEGKNIFIDFFTEWCGPCKRLASQVFPAESVGQYLNANFVCLKIDAEKGEGPQLAKKFGVKAYPTLAVIDSEGELIGSFEGFKDPGEFISAVKMSSDPAMSVGRVKEQYEAGVRNANIVLAYANIIRDSTRDIIKGTEQANNIVDEYFASLSDEERMDPLNNDIYISFNNSYSSPRVKFLINNLDRFPADCVKPIKDNLLNVYLYEAYNYFGDNLLRDNHENLQAYCQFKSEANQLNFADSLTRLFTFTEMRANSDDEKYLAYCDKNFDTLNESEQAQFIYCLPKIFPSETPEQKTSLSKWLRTRIGTLSPSNVYTAAMTILTLENAH